MKPKINYNSFKAEYLNNFKIMMTYKPNEIGSKIYAEKMAEMYDLHPEWVEKIEEKES